MVVSYYSYVFDILSKTATAVVSDIAYTIQVGHNYVDESGIGFYK